jgi:hypothetical protein
MSKGQINQLFKSNSQTVTKSWMNKRTSGSSRKITTKSQAWRDHNKISSSETPKYSVPNNSKFGVKID